MDLAKYPSVITAQRPTRRLALPAPDQTAPTVRLPRHRYQRRLRPSTLVAIILLVALVAVIGVMLAASRASR
jgi:hypothetical protein